MIRLLVSVRDAREAATALRGGAAIIDMKEPRHGSLGAAPVRQWQQIFQQCGSKAPLSAALGELLDEQLGQRLDQLPSVGYAKVGLAGCRTCSSWLPRWRWAIEQLPAATRPVAVIYADAAAARSPEADEILQHARELGCVAVLWDTWDKTQGNLLSHTPVNQLHRQLERARQDRLLTVLAGSLTTRELPTISRLAPNYLAVRKAVCRPSRTGSVREHLVVRLASALATLDQVADERHDKRTSARQPLIG